MRRSSQFSILRVCLPLTIIFSVAAFAADQPVNLKSLYEGHHWFQLRDAIANEKAPELYQGAVAAAFDQRDEAVAHLQRAITSAPQSSEAVEAREILLHLFMRASQYSKAVSVMKEQIAARIGKPATDGDRASIALLSQLPDMAVLSRGKSTLRYEMRGANLGIPVSINNKPANFLLDTDANLSGPLASRKPIASACRYSRAR